MVIMNDPSTPTAENAQSPIVSASHILLLKIESADPTPWASHPKWGYQRTVTLRLLLAEILKGDLNTIEGNDVILDVIQYDYRSPFNMPPVGVWSALDPTSTDRIAAFCRGAGDDLLSLLKEPSCLEVAAADRPLDALRLALAAEAEGWSLRTLLEKATGITDRLDGMFVTYLKERLADADFFEEKPFETAMELLESPGLKPSVRATLLNTLRNRVSRSQQAEKEHIHRLAIAMFRLLGMKEAAMLHDNLRQVFLPNLLGIKGGAPKASAGDVFEAYPEDRDAVKNRLARKRQLAGSVLLRQWLNEAPTPAEGAD